MTTRSATDVAILSRTRKMRTSISPRDLASIIINNVAVHIRSRTRLKRPQQKNNKPVIKVFITWIRQGAAIRNRDLPPPPAITASRIHTRTDKLGTHNMFAHNCFFFQCLGEFAACYFKYISRLLHTPTEKVAHENLPRMSRTRNGPL